MKLTHLLLISVTIIFVQPCDVLAVQSLELYNVLYLDDGNKAFISVSDNYPLSDHIDSSAVPKIKEIDVDSSLYFTLSPLYRQRFLTKTGLSEVDKIFIYDYSVQKLVELQVNELNVVAKLSPYVMKDEWPFSQNDYMIGFEIDTNNLNGLSPHYFNSIVYIGQKNPFVQGELQQIIWEEINLSEFPNSLISEKYTKEIEDKNFELTKCYLYNTTNSIYYIQDFKKNEWNYAKRIIVVDKASNGKIYEGIYLTHEGTSFAPKDNQWTGQLFRDKPPVIFGFQWQSFGCPGITFIDSEIREIRINCDNRH